MYISCVFKKNKSKALSSAYMCHLLYPDAEIDLGGSGVDIHKQLFDGRYDLMKPDYDLYPNMTYSLGYTTRGCIRHCYFCIVHDKEGKFRRVQHPREWHDDRFNDITILDNNILADKEWFMEVTDWILSKGLRVDFNQGLDIRLVDSEIAQRISELTPIKKWEFAFDDMNYRDEVERGIRILRDNGVNPRNNVLFYVYCHDDAHVDDAVARCNLLKQWNTGPFVMLNQDVPRTQRMTDLKRWAIPYIFWSCDFNDYVRSLKKEDYQ